MTGNQPHTTLNQAGNTGLIMGGLIVLAGLLMAMTPVLTFISLTALIAVLLVVAGIAALVDAVRRPAMERKMLDCLLGVLAIVLAGVIVFHPFGAAVGLTVWIAAWLIARGVLELAGMGASPYGRWIMALDAVVNIALGLALLFLNPLVAQAVLGFYIAISLVFWGVSLIYRSALLKRLG